MAASLDSAWSKWERGKTYFETLKRELAGNLPNVPWAHTHSAVCETQPGGLEYRFYVTLPPLDSVPIAGVSGDCLFNLRCALDHLVYALHENVLTPAQLAAVEKHTRFPILLPSQKRTAKGGAPLPTSRWEEIKALGDSERRRIEFFQPYKGTDPLNPYGRVRHWLGELNRLNNIDKHRYVHVVRNASQAVPVPKGLEPYGFQNEIFWHQSLDDKTEVFRWTFDSAPPNIAHYVQMNSQVYVGVSIKEAGGQSILLVALPAMIEAVKFVLTKFETFFR